MPDMNRGDRMGRLQTEVARRAGGGEMLSGIDRDVIAPSGLSEEGKSALWLYGWAHREGGRRRYEDRQARFRHQAGRLRPPWGNE
jgi:hypothetical protein